MTIRLAPRRRMVSSRRSLSVGLATVIKAPPRHRRPGRTPRSPRVRFGRMEKERGGAGKLFERRGIFRQMGCPTCPCRSPITRPRQWRSMEFPPRRTGHRSRVTSARMAASPSRAPCSREGEISHLHEPSSQARFSGLRDHDRHEPAEQRLEPIEAQGVLGVAPGALRVVVDPTNTPSTPAPTPADASGARCIAQAPPRGSRRRPAAADCA